MNYHSKTVDNVKLELSTFSKNGVDEIHLMAKPKASGTFADQLQQITQAQEQYLQAHNIPGDALILSRYFISDYANQSEALELIHALSKNGAQRAAISIVQQPSLAAHKVMAWSYLIHDKNQDRQHSKQISNNDLLVSRGDYRHLWSTRLTSSDGMDSAHQTDHIFKAYNDQLEANGFSFKDDCIRTWLFVKDIDFNYQGVVEARNQFFDELDLTSKTHFVTSTGIEGRSAYSHSSVLMDAYSVAGLAQKQIRFLEARNNLNPTHEYGVAFERGTSIEYGDRKHVLISGTASINNKGEILHVNDVTKQAARAIENIAALLADADTCMQDVAHMIVYLRDLADASAVKRYFEEHHQAIPKAFVLAPVCRPGWLIEIECMAIKSIEQPCYNNF
jgi:enamine deaminase RidA (YjgF/YER057c/UK114 family)